MESVTALTRPGRRPVLSMADRLVSMSTGIGGRQLAGAGSDCQRAGVGVIGDSFHDARHRLKAR